MMLLPTVKGLYLGNGVFAGKMTQDFRDFQEKLSKLSLSDNQTILRALFADFAQEGTMEKWLDLGADDRQLANISFPDVSRPSQTLAVNVWKH
jgi:hypothetical protein